MNVCGHLARLCDVLRTLLYVERDEHAAQQYLKELRSLLHKLPKSDGSIIGAEGHAIYHELTGNISQAIASRLREIDLMAQLYDDIRKHKYDKGTKAALLSGRGRADLRARKFIISALRRKLKK